MATTTITNNCRRDLWSGVIDIENDTIKCALYNTSGHDANTGAYTTTAEVAGSGYSAGGNTLTGATVAVDTSNNVSYVDFADTSWTSSTITATDMMIYDDTVTTPTANVALYIGDFNGSKSSSSGTFQIVMPTAAYNSAIMRLA